MAFPDCGRYPTGDAAAAEDLAVVNPEFADFYVGWSRAVVPMRKNL